MDIHDKRIAVLSPVAWRTPPRTYGAWETVASNITEGLVNRGWKNVTLFATGDSITQANLCSSIDTGYEEDTQSRIAQVSTALHIAKAMEQAHEFDLIHNHFDYMPLTYSRLIKTPILTTIHGFSDPDILRIYREYQDTYYVSISDSDRDADLSYMATVYNGIDLQSITFHEEAGSYLVSYGRIHPDKGVHLAIEVAKRCKKPLLIAGVIQDQSYFDHYIKQHLDDTQIKYIGPVTPDQRNELLSQALAVLHLNTIKERFGLVLAESMAAGVPVIAKDLGSCREVVVNEKTGFLVNDVSEAVKAIAKLSQIDRVACRQHVEANFTVDHMVAGYEKVYEEIFKKRS